MSVSDRYSKAWEGFWEETSGVPGEAIWDADPALTAVPHLALLEPYLDPALPIVDLGCGNGTQTRFLATRFPRALGVDLSRAAVEHARRSSGAAGDRGAEFEQLDLVDTADVRALHGRLGDCNVYMRAVIHQSDPQDRAAVAEAVAELVGTRGRGFVVELRGRAKEVLQEVARQPGGPTRKLQRVFAHGLRPAEAADDEVRELLRAAGLELFAEGDIDLAMEEFHADGRRIELPARWFVTGRH
ncbi:class I SAM-dependent methyltransferase [Streptomyces netropsis]|uniref:class I SAM-dependent methyltransferase n=1 Tax=Streptomyces netropsis TaxID=55404 RepID=UPI0030CCAC78